MTRLVVYNIKGGVGKTATAVNLAWLASRRGMRTLLWDLDPQGAASFYLRVRPGVSNSVSWLVRGKRRAELLLRETDHDSLDLLPADFALRHLDQRLGDAGKPERRLERAMRPLASLYDLLVVDSAPSISLSSESLFHAADCLLVPTIPTTLSLRTLDQLRRHLDTLDAAPTVLPFFCMVDRRKAMHREIRDAHRSRDGFLEAEIPYSSDVERMGRRRAPLGTFAGASQAAAAYRELFDELLARLGIVDADDEDAGAWQWDPGDQPNSSE